MTLKFERSLTYQLGCLKKGVTKGDLKPDGKQQVSKLRSTNWPNVD